MATPSKVPSGCGPHFPSLPFFWLGETLQISSLAASIACCKPSVSQTMQRNSPENVFAQNKSQDVCGGVCLLDAWQRTAVCGSQLTRQHKGLWEQNLQMLGCLPCWGSVCGRKNKHKWMIPPPSFHW